MLSFHRLFYDLKKNFGTEIDIVQIVESTVDDDTGNREIIRRYYTVPAVLLPEDRASKFIQDIGYLAANKNFTYGAYNDFNTMKTLIHVDDLPEGLDINLEGWINKGPRRFEKVSFTSMLDELYLLTVRGVEGGLPFSQANRRVETRLQLGGRATFELN